MNDAIIVALAGFIGTLIGAIAAISGHAFRRRLEAGSRARADLPRKALLRKMLQHEDHQWRRLRTLSSVIGADEETTKRLLLEIGARASEDGRPLWALIENKPLPDCR